MRIVRYQHEGIARYGIVEDGGIRTCAGTPYSGLTRQAAVIDLSDVRLLPPVEPPNIICLGLNYRAHAAETGHPLPEAPLVFIKATTALCGPGDSIVLPSRYPDQIDYEAELAIVIGKVAKDVPEDQAGEFILGYTAANDVSNRAVQFSDGQWARAKSHDTFCPVGPAIVTGLDADNLAIICRLDGEVMQSSTTADMIFPVRRIISHLSHSFTLLPGTLILTGTPGGVGFMRKPPVYLRPGQVVEVEIEGIGILVNQVVGCAG
ncbi:MAG: FAA hydrolase family protein [Deltaproteobacteria bacterium]|nr:FAA hydrolase family protein [Deltaproteobacteria bacterium]TLN04191.1 MAG: fumarylacetoacetate hydrolase family protein [bacterium]